MFADVQYHCPRPNHSALAPEEKWSHYRVYELSWQGGDIAPQRTQYLLSLTVQTAQALSNGP